MVTLLMTLTIEDNHVIVKSQLNVYNYNYNCNWPMSAAADSTLSPSTESSYYGARFKHHPFGLLGDRRLASVEWPFVPMFCLGIILCLSCLHWLPSCGPVAPICILSISWRRTAVNFIAIDFSIDVQMRVVTDIYVDQISCNRIVGDDRLVFITVSLFNFVRIT